MRRILKRLLAAVVTGGMLFGLPYTVYAFPPNTLAEALTRSTDPARQKIPLLVINPENVRVDWENRAGREKLNRLFENEEIKPRLSEVVEGFNRQLVSCSSVQVVAPLTRVVLNPYPGPVEEWATIGRERAAKLLFASLTPAQWATASSPNGIGIPDLSKPEQKAWFQSMIPNPFTVRQVTQSEGGGHYVRDDDRRQTVSPDQVRVRVVRNMNWMYKSSRENGSYYGFGFSMSDGHKPGDSFWVQDSQPGQETRETYRDNLKDVVRVEEPNRLKKSDIGFNNAPLFGARILLKDVKTVGDVVQRVAEKTGLEIYADRRLSSQTVKILGPQDASVDAADVMKAFCYAFAGAIRKVSDESGDTVYILTSDRQGLIAPRLRLAEWADDVEALLNVEQDAFYKATRSGSFIQGVGFNENSPRVGAETMARAEAELVSPDRYKNNNSGYTRVPVSELAPEMQQSIAKSLEQRGTYSPLEVDEKNIYASFGVSTELLVPGYGKFSGPALSSLENMLNTSAPAAAPNTPNVPAGPISLPSILQELTALKIAPKSDEETDKVVRWARSHGFKALFVCASLWKGDDSARLVHAMEVGKAHGIKIYPAVSLLKVPPFEAAKKDVAPNNLPRTQNIFGETLRQYAYRRGDAPAIARQQRNGFAFLPQQSSDWLEPQSKEVRKAVADRVKTFADMPGIGGIVLSDTSTPGYNLNSNSYTEGSLGGQYGGYNNTLRVALIRQQNLDPVDVPPAVNMSPYMSVPQEGLVPYFPMDWNFQELMRQSAAYRKDPQSGAWASKEPDNTGYFNDVSGWNLLRRDKNREWMRQIRRDIHLPGELPVYWEMMPESVFGGSWITLWKDADALPPAERGPLSLMTMTLRPTTTQDTIKAGLGLQFQQRMDSMQTKPYNGIVIDTTGIDLDKALTLLDSLRKVE